MHQSATRRDGSVMPAASVPDPAASQSPCRLLVVPGLSDSSPAHWQTWLQLRYRDSQRVYQRNWNKPALEPWASRIREALDAAGPGTWIAVAHGFGALALVRHLLDGEPRVRHALLVAPVDPFRVGIDMQPLAGALPLPTTLLVSSNDRWMPLDEAHAWAHHWGSEVINLGAAGHVNAESGFGPLPAAAVLIDRLLQAASPSSSPAAPPSVTRQASLRPAARNTGRQQPAVALLRPDIAAQAPGQRRSGATALYPR